MELKKDIRKLVLERRSHMSEKEWEEKSRSIYEKVVTHPFFLDASTIYCYVDYRCEAGTRAIIEKAWEMQKKVAVPRVEGTELRFYYIRQFSELTEGYKGIFEPKTEFPADAENALVIMPGVAFDRYCNRIGYGKGFYDRFFNQYEDYRTMALAFELQLVDRIPTDEHDICPELLVTEEQIYDRNVTK